MSRDPATSMPEPLAHVADWTDLTHRLPRTEGWMHSGVAVDLDGSVFCAHPNGSALVALTLAGKTATVPTTLSELHGIAVGPWAGTLAVADPGYRMDHDDLARYSATWTPGRAVIISSSTGDVLLELEQPHSDAYRSQPWRPTSIDIDRQSSGDIWVADGYGANLVHRFDRSGRLLHTVDGRETGTAFDCPHGLMVRRQEDGSTEVLVADRANHRLVRLDHNGRLLGVFGTAALDSPSGLVELNNQLFVTELFGGVARFDSLGRFLGVLEPGRPRSHESPDWPNEPGRTPGTMTAPQVTRGTFNSPHGLATDGHGLYITEWLIGGRLLHVVPR